MIEGRELVVHGCGFNYSPTSLIYNCVSVRTYEWLGDPSLGMILVQVSSCPLFQTHERGDLQG